MLVWRLKYTELSDSENGREVAYVSTNEYEFFKN